MKKITDWLRGYHRITVTGGAPQWCLNRLTEKHIPFWDIVWSDEFTVSFSVYRKCLQDTKKCVQSSMCRVECVQTFGPYQTFGGLRRRWCLTLMLIFACVSALVVPRFIWFYEVEGNIAVPTEKIIRAVQACGVELGTYGKSIRPHLVRERVLTEIPELSWLTVTQNCGRAKISVRERELPQKVTDRRVPQNVVASHSGMITRVSVLEGSPAVKVGQMVEKGQLLINGYMDLEYKYRVCGAMGEVYARTWRDVYAITPQTASKKEYSGKEKTVYYLRFGRKRIKLSLGSGILPADCDKMSKSICLTLPRGLSLPVSLDQERYRFYEPVAFEVSADDVEKMMLDLATAQTEADMIAGTVLSEQHVFGRENGNYTLHTMLSCEEMISHGVAAEIFKGERTNDGTSN